MFRISVTLLTILLLGTGFPFTAAATRLPWKQEPRRSAAALPAPQPRAPANGAQLPDLAAVTLAWDLPAGAAQMHVQVTPAHNDGPGVNLIQTAAGWFTVAAPPAWYVLLPGMSYTWRVRVSDKTTFAPEDDPSWGPWSETWSFRTPPPSSAGLRAIAPAEGASVAAAGPVTLRWLHPHPGIFYWEVQVSGDPLFDADPATATSFVWHNLVHGGVTDPLHSWRSPAVEAGKTYYWRVRPRVQGDGAPVEWSTPFAFRTLGATGLPTGTADPYFPSLSERIGQKYSGGVTTEISVGKDIINRGELGQVFVNVVNESKGVTNSIVFSMDKGESIIVTAVFPGIYGPGPYRFTWSTRRALPGDANTGIITIKRSTMRRVSLYQGDINDVALLGDTAYIIRNGNFCTLDVHDPASPQEVGSCIKISQVFVSSEYKTFIRNGYAFITVSHRYRDYKFTDYDGDENGLYIVDLGANRRIIGRYPTEADEIPAGLAVTDGYVYLVIQERREGGKLIIIDVNNPVAPKEVGRLPISVNSSGGYNGPGSITINHNYAYLWGSGGLYIIDVSTVASPRLIARNSSVGCWSPFYRTSIAISNNFAYLSGRNCDHLLIFDVNMPTDPTLIRDMPIKVSVKDILAVGDRVYLAGDMDALTVLDVRNPAAPIEVGRYVGLGANGSRVAVNGEHVYLAGSGGLHILRR